MNTRTMWMALANMLALSVFAGGEAYEIGAAMGEEGFWKSDPVLFVGKHQTHGFKFTSESRTSADSRREGGVTWFGVPVYESRLTFGEKGGIARVELTLFSRGGTEALQEIDMGGGQKMRRIQRVDKEMTKDEFDKVIADVGAKLTPSGKKPPATTAQNMKDTNIRQRSQTWKAGGKSAMGAATLTWNYEVDGNKKFSRPGFIRLAVEGAGSAAKAGDAPQKAAQRKGGAKLTDNVVKESRGDVFIDNVPMVDQGQKGYCAVATSERVMRYYGLDVDEHEIAAAADTQAEGGTSTAAMIAAVRAIGQKHRLATAVLYGDADKGSGERIANLTDEVRQYNKAAKKLKKPLIKDEDYITCSGNMISYNPAAVDAKMDAEVLKELRVNRSGKPQYMKFMKNVHQYVNEGKPLIWGVTLGTYPEADLPQAKGGHMRLIIGYNDKKGEILYSDSWGKGHELKRMPADWAWTITHSLLGLRPLK